MFTVSRALYAPKEGNIDDQYEDAFAVCGSALPDRFTVAVSDGASSAGYAREWANLLTQSFAKDEPFPGDATFFARILALGEEWRGQVEGGATSWYAQEKLESGSAATLLVVTLDADAKTLSASCVGDVCLFVIRRDKLRFGFPVTRSKGFSNRPDLLSTENIGTRKPPTLLNFSTSIEPGDRLFFLTDAVAQYFLARFETRREKPWHNLPRTQTDLAPWLQEKRDSGELKNDDVTILEVNYSVA